MRVVGFHLQGDEIFCSDGTTEKEDYLGFLLKDRGETLNVFYNLDWAVARLCYLLEVPEYQLQKFWKKNMLWLAGHTIFFIPHRYLSVKFGKHFGSAEFTDISQYENLPFEIDPLDAARKAQEVGQRVYDVLTRLELHPTTLSSPIAAYQKEILSTLDLPKPEDIPPEVQLYAHKCLHGGWMEATARGHFDKVYDLDINSAFSFHTANLIDTRYGTWFKSDKFYSKLPYGFCKGIVDVESEFNSIIYTHKNENGDTIDYTPVGLRDDYLTNAHIRNMYDNEEGRFKLFDAWYWKPDGDLVYPLKEHVERLFEWKQYLKGFDREIIKRILVGLTGKLIETFQDGEDRVAGKLYNLPWYSWVQDQTKIQDVNFVIQNKAEDALLSIEVDGLKFSREIPIKNSNEMGDWRLNMVAPAFIVSSGVGCIKGKEGKGAFALTYDWLESKIKENPEATEYTMTKLSPVTIGNALKNHKLDKLGELEMTERAVILNEFKRMYSDYPRKGADLMNQYKSQAMDISILQKEDVFTRKSTSDLDISLTTA